MAGENLDRSLGKNVRVAFSQGAFASWSGLLTGIEDGGVTVTKGTDARFIPFSSIVCIYLTNTSTMSDDET